MVLRYCLVLAGRWGDAFVGCCQRAIGGLCGGRCCMVAVWVIRRPWGRGGGLGCGVRSVKESWVCSKAGQGPCRERLRSCS